jgi:pyruvate/2-oxoacid:ferredoxin oxidoreductase alpha subunit
LAFELADTYRAPVMVVGNGKIGQMTEPVEFNPNVEETMNDYKKSAATDA